MSESKKKKTEIEKLKEEKKDVEEELAKTRADFLKDNERRRRTHRLVIKGAIVEDIAPCLKGCSDQEFYGLMDEIFSLPQVLGLIMARQEGEQEGENG